MAEDIGGALRRSSSLTCIVCWQRSLLSIYVMTSPAGISLFWGVRTDEPPVPEAGLAGVWPVTAAAADRRGLPGWVCRRCTSLLHREPRFPELVPSRSACTREKNCQTAHDRPKYHDSLRVIFLRQDLTHFFLNRRRGTVRQWNY